MCLATRMTATRTARAFPALLLLLVVSCSTTPATDPDPIRRQGLIGNPSVAFERDGATWVGDWPLEHDQPIPFFSARRLSSLHVVLKVPTWLQITLDGEHVSRRRFEAGTHRLGVRAGAGLHQLRVHADGPVRVFAQPTPVDGLPAARMALTVRVPNGGTIDFDALAGTLKGGVLSCGGQDTQLVAEEHTITVPACPHVARLSLVWSQRAPRWAELQTPAPSPEPRATPRGVVVVLVDTLRRDRTAGFSETAPSSPATQHLVTAGTRFTNALAAANWTKPSVASLLTGEHPAVHRANMHGSSLGPDAPVVSRALSSAGVSTAAFVANGYITPRHGFGGGWDRFTRAIDLDVPRADGLFEAALGWLDTVGGDERFFVYVHTSDVHYPYDPPERFLQGVPHALLQPRSNPRLLHQVTAGERSLSAPERQELVARYDAGVRAHDEALGSFVSGLQARGLLDEVLFVLVSDHGEELFDHGSVDHGGERMWPELIRVPLVLRWPMGQAGIDDTPVGHVDVAATLRDVFDVPAIGSGRSLRRVPAGVVSPAGSARPGRIVVIWDGVRGVEYDLRTSRIAALDVNLERTEAVDPEHVNTLLRWHAVTHPFVSTGVSWAAQRDLDVERQLRALGYVE